MDWLQIALGALFVGVAETLLLMYQWPLHCHLSLRNGCIDGKYNAPVIGHWPFKKALLEDD